VAELNLVILKMGALGAFGEGKLAIYLSASNVDIVTMLQKNTNNIPVTFSG